MYVNKQEPVINILARRQFLLSTIERRKLSLFSHIANTTQPKTMRYIKCGRRSGSETTSVDGLDSIKDWAGQASHCGRCYALQTTEAGEPSSRIEASV